MSDDSGVVKYYASLLGRYPQALHIFTRGGGAIGYHVLGPWAVRVATDFAKSAGVVMHWGADKTPAVVVNDSMYRDVVREALLHSGVDVMLHDRRPNSTQWFAAQRGSPGNLGGFEPLLFDSTQDAEVSAAATGSVVVAAGPTDGHSAALSIGVATLNATLRRIGVAQFTDTASLSHLDAALSQLGLREVLYPAALEAQRPAAFAALTRAVERVGGVVLRPLPEAQFAAAGVAGRLEELVSTHAKRAAFDLSVQTHAAAALAGLLAHTELHADANNRRAFTVLPVDITSLLRLDAAAIAALDLVAHGAEAPRGEVPISIYGWLNRCVTGMGSRLLREWLLQPLRDVAAIEQRLAIVEALAECPTMRDSLRNDVLRHCLDLDRLGRKLQRGNAGLKDVHALKSVVLAIPVVVRVLHSYSGPAAALLTEAYVAPLEEIFGMLGNLSTLIDATLVPSPGGGTVINPEFDDDLMELHEERQRCEADMEAGLRALLAEYGWTEKQVKLDHHPTHGHVFRVSRKDDKPVRDHPKAFTIFNTGKDGVRFATAAQAECNAALRDVMAQYEKRQSALQAKLMETVATYLPVLDDTKEIFARLDVFAAWATVVSESRVGMVRPAMREPGAEGAALRLREVRHPLVELRRETYVPSTVAIGDGLAAGDGAGDPNAWIITGPNMGGKSTLMRSVGVAVVLAHIGCFVPAAAAEVVVRDAVLCRVGATDYMTQGLSTFMVEMLESSSIVAAATPASLVIVDELGRGTSTFDGFGLAWAIGEELACRARAQVLFATHFHELTAIAADHPGRIANVHVDAVVRAAADGAEELDFRYTVTPGASGRSYGVAVARMAGLPDAVLALASAKVAELEGSGDTAVKLERGVRERMLAFVRQLSLARTDADVAALKASLEADPLVAAAL